MTPSQLRNKWNALDKKCSALNDAFIKAGRGYETGRETLAMSRYADSLTTTYHELFDARAELERIGERQWGPDWMQVMRYGLRKNKR